jgi:hypothetical protein
LPQFRKTSKIPLIVQKTFSIRKVIVIFPIVLLAVGDKRKSRFLIFATSLSGAFTLLVISVPETQEQEEYMPEEDVTSNKTLLSVHFTMILFFWVSMQ